MLSVVVVELAYLRVALGTTPTGIDALTFHLPGVASWIQDGSIWHIAQFVPDQAHGNYPGNGDMLLLAGVLPWHDDFLLHVVFLPWLAFTGLATYALARELRAPRATATLAGAMVVSLPRVLFDSVESTLPDVVMFSTFAAGLTFLLRHHRTPTTAPSIPRSGTCQTTHQPDTPWAWPARGVRPVSHRSRPCSDRVWRTMWCSWVRSCKRCCGSIEPGPRSSLGCGLTVSTSCSSDGESPRYRARARRAGFAA